MKAIFLTAVLCFGWVFAFAQISVYDCALENPEVTQQEVEETNDFYKPCIKFEEGVNYNFNTNPNGTREVKASPDGNIHIEKNFHAGRYTGDSQMNLKLQEEKPFDVWVMNYDALDGIRKLDRFEIGVQLPQEIHEKVENFVNDETGEKINPFLEWEIKVVAEFTYFYYDNPNTSYTYSIDGYYSRDYQPYMIYQTGTNEIAPDNGVYYENDEYEALGGYTLIANGHPNFRVRFAPPITGSWRCVVKLIMPNETITGIPFDFVVVDSNRKGYLRTGPNGRYFTRGNESFFPIGCNIPWPETTAELEKDTTFLNYVVSDNSAQESYRDGVYCLPRVYDSYRAKIGEIADKGANMFRMIMFPTATDLEWEKLGNYSDRLHMAQELDSILNYCESKDMMILWNMQIHYCFGASAGAYWVNYGWDSQHSDGERFCYADLLGYSLDDIGSFLTDETAIEYFQQKMRYYISRWGYSTNIGIFELFSEQNLIDPDGSSATASDNNPYLDNYNDYKNFQVSVMNYLNSHYNASTHLSTTSFAVEKHQEDKIFTEPNTPFSVSSSNRYDYDFGKYNFWLGFKETSQFEIMNAKGIAKRHLHLLGENTYVKDEVRPMPMILSETGVEKEDLICNREEIPPYLKRIESKRHFWHSLFSGCAGAFSWDDRKHPIMFDNYYSADFVLNSIKLSENQWHPGQMKLKNNNKWKYKRNYAKRMRGESSFKSTFSYLRKGNKKAAIGVVSNNTFNFINQLPCADSIGKGLEPLYIINDDTVYVTNQNNDLDRVSEFMQTTETLNLKANNRGENLKFKGMIGGEYYVSFYNPVTLNALLVTTAWGPNVKLKYQTMPADYNNYIVLVTAIRVNHSWMSILPSDSSEITELATIRTEKKDVNIYPNPAQRSVTIDLGTNSIKRISIFSSNGSKVKLIEEESLKKPTLEFDVSSWANGTYLVHLLSHDHQVLIKKIVKL